MAVGAVRSEAVVEIHGDGVAHELEAFAGPVASYLGTQSGGCQ